MAEKRKQQFGTRVPQVPPPSPSPPAKRSGHVALLLMGTLAVGSSAYMLMPQNKCEPNQPGVTQPSSAECQGRSSSSSGGSGGGSGGSSRYYGSGSSSSSGTTETSSVKRGGFGSSGQSFSSHFSFGS
jgi:hypothetical protein